LVETGKFLSDVARGKGWRRIGYEANFSLIAPAWQSSEIVIPSENTRAMYEASFPGVELVDATALIQNERRRKTPYEAEKLRIASEISSIGMEVFQQMAEIGVSGIELVAAVEAEIMSKGIGYKGAQRVRGYAQLAGGADESSIAFRMNEISTTRRLQNGDVALLELGVVADGFWADRTRVRVAGQPTDEQARVFETLVKAQEAACAALRPGVTGAYVDGVGRAIIRDAGMDAYFPHITGHGLGFGYHEASPKLAPGSADVMEEGFFVSVEPGIYYQAVGGFRIEDDVLVTSDGFEVLGPFTKQL
jgi:Xaa-Pro dipeptidase